MANAWCQSIADAARRLEDAARTVREEAEAGKIDVLSGQFIGGLAWSLAQTIGAGFAVGAHLDRLRVPQMRPGAEV